MASTQSAAATLRAAWIAHAQARPIVTLGLIGTVLVVLTLSIASGYNAFQNGNESNVRYALLGGCAGFAATALGAPGWSAFMLFVLMLERSMR